MKEELYRINQKSETKDLIRFHLCGTTFPDKSYKIYRPSSAVWCIEYVEEGCGTIHLNEETFFPKAGDSYFLHAGKDHYYYSNCDVSIFSILVREARFYAKLLQKTVSLKNSFHAPFSFYKNSIYSKKRTFNDIL